MRILIIASERPPVTSGVARSIGRLTRGLREHGHQVDTMTGADAPYFRSGEVRLSAVGGKLLRLTRRIGAEYDVVNVHGPVPTISDVSLVLMRLLSREGGPRVMYSHHWTLEFEKGLFAGLDGPYMSIHHQLARLADHVVVASEAYADLFKGGRAPPVSIIPWGVDPDRFRPAGPTGYDGTRPLRVLLVGQLRPYKGAMVAVDAIANQPDIDLTIVGRGPQEASLRRRVLEVEATNIHLVGYLDEEALVESYRVHDVCILPSLTRVEAFGLVLLEGMAAACVPVASDLPGVRDLAQPNGLLVAPGDPLDLRWALRSLAARPETVGRLQARAMDVADQHSWDVACAAYSDLAEQLTRSAAPRPAAVAG